MSDQSGPSHFQELFEAAFRNYENQTGKALANHPLAEKLQICDSVESVIAVLRGQIETSSEIRKDNVLKPLKNVLSVLHSLSSNSGDLGLVRQIGTDWASLFLTVILQPLSPIKAIQTGLGILLSVCPFHSSLNVQLRDIQTYQAVKGLLDDYDTLADLLESVEHFMNRLDIYTKIPPTISMTEIIVKILVKLLSIIALATKQLQQGKLSESVLDEIFIMLPDYAMQKRLSRRSSSGGRTSRRYFGGWIGLQRMRLG